MATVGDGIVGQRSIGRGFMADQGFFTRYTIILAALILFGFLQFEMRGFVDIRNVPPFLHLHGGFMVSWLALICAQNVLVSRSQLQLHRTLGWVGAVLAAAVVAMASYTGYQAIARGMVPPFFSVPQFLALTQVEALSFGLLVVLAIAYRKQTQFHRRFMLISTIQIVEPALGRLLPMPLLGGWGEWLILTIQLIMLAVLARHDRRILGLVHPATLIGGAVVVASHVLTSMLAALPSFAAYAQAIAAG